MSAQLGASAVAGVGWALAVVLIMVASRPRIRRSTSAPATAADVPPALLALLFSRDGRVPERAASATLLDLAARGLFDQDVDRQGHRWLRARGAVDTRLRPYEQQVYDHVVTRTRLGSGLVPEDAVRLESREHARKWLDRFAEQVVADAYEGGLVRRRAPKARVALQLGLLAPVVLAELALVGRPPRALPWLGGLWLIMGYGLLSRCLRPLSRPVPTSSGERLAGGYRPLLAELDAGAPVDLAPPVTRRVAYAVTLGVPTQPPGYTPLAPRSTTFVWSHRTGVWRQVRVVDQRGLFVGVEPRTALFVIPGAVPFFGIWFLLLRGAGSGQAPFGFDVPVALVLLGWLLWGLGSLAVWRFVHRALHDLSHPCETTVGQVVHLESDPGDGDSPPSCTVALDDGRSDVAITYAIDAATFAELRFGSWLRLQVTPKLRHVANAEVVRDDGPTE